MQRCLELALNGSGQVAPNPMVGAVLVHDEKIVGEGWHMKYGGPHAEVNAVNNISDPSLLPECTLYVSLEPCSHFGKTPPCSDLIINAGIRKVVICNTDPNPLVSGKGITRLRKAGIDVTTGVLQKEGEILNRRFFLFHERKRPYVVLKWAQSSDGFLAPHPDKGKKGITWLSNPLSRSLTHVWRAEEASILVGSNTVVNDDPRLNVRGIAGNDPVRIIIDPDLICSKGKKVFSSGTSVFVFNHTKTETVRNVSYHAIPKGKQFLKTVMQSLYEKGIQSVLVEGGAFTLNSFIKENLWDEARVFRTGVTLGNGIQAPELPFIPDFSMRVLSDQLDHFTNQHQ